MLAKTLKFKKVILQVAVGAILCIVVYYLFNQYAGKALWDWLELLVIPVVLAVAALLFNQRENNIERELAREKRNEDIFQNFIDKMTELMLKENLLEAEDGDKVLDIARARITSTLRALHGDTVRLNGVIQFLREADLLRREGRAGILANSSLQGIDLKEVSLTGIDLSNANLMGSNLSGTDLREANLSGGDLWKANLFGADLRKADLGEADLREADLRRVTLFDANLREANLTRAILVESSLVGTDLFKANMNGIDLRGVSMFGANLREANLTGALLPDATTYTTATDMACFTDSQSSRESKMK